MQSSLLLSTHEITSSEAFKRLYMNFNINSLPLILIRKILGYFQLHFNTVCKLYKLDDRWNDAVIRLSLVCKLWAQKVVPFINDSTYYINSKQLLTTYLKLSGYGLLYPARLLPFNQTGLGNPSSFIKRLPDKHPYSFERLMIIIDYRQVPHAHNSVIPTEIYNLLVPPSSESLHHITFSTQQPRKSDLTNFLNVVSLNTSITSLNISGSMLQNETLRSLAKFISKTTTLRKLNCKGSTIYDDIKQEVQLDFVNSFSVNRSIQSLNLLGFEPVSREKKSELFESLCSGSCPLEKLYISISNNSFSHSHHNNFIFPTSPKITTLKHLGIDLNSSIIPQFITFLNQIPSLNTLDLTGSDLSSAHLERLFSTLSTTHTKSLVLANCHYVATDLQADSFANANFHPLDFINGNQTLTKLDVSSFGLTDVEGSLLLQALKTNTTLTHLNMSNNQLSCTTELVALICSNHIISNLNLLSNRFCVDFPKLCLALKLSKTITSLSLRSNSLEDDMGAHLSEYIKHSTIIKHLDIGGNQFRLLTPHHLQSALAQNKSLITLDLSHTRLDQIGLEGILYSLCEHGNISIVLLKGIDSQSQNMLRSLIQTLGLRCLVVY